MKNINSISKHLTIPSVIADISRGFLAGFIATIPMTLFMNKMFEKLPKVDKSPLPPRKITMNIAEKLDIKKNLDESEKIALTLMSHYSYGGAMGALFASVADAYKLDKIHQGAIFGLIVWTGSYLGYLPAVHLHKSATEEPADRNLLMIAAHIVWGIGLAASLKYIKKPNLKSLQN